MKDVERIKADVEPRPLLDEIAAVDGAWDAVTGRQDEIVVRREAHAIPLRGLKKSAIGDEKRRDVHASPWTTASKNHPLACFFLKRTATELDGLLGRAKIVCLPAGRRVSPHIDRGEYDRLRNRYHLVLRSTVGSRLKAADEEVRMRAGELGWFDNDQMHEAINDGAQDRIHMIFDRLPRARVAEVFPDRAVVKA